MEQDRRDSPPLWLQLPVTALLRRQCRPSSSLINNPVTLVILLPPLALILLFCLLSPFVSHNFQTIQISLVKNRWDSLNIVLVLFAILCGVAAKMFDRESEAGAEEAPVHKSNVSSMITNDSFSLGIPEIGTFQIFDDFDITNIYAPESKIMRCCEGRSEEGRNDLDIKVIQVDTCVVRQAPLLSQSENSRASPAPPSYQPLESAEPEATRQNSRRRQSPKSIVYAEKQLNGCEIYKSGSPPPPPPPEQKRNDKIERKKSGATKEIATAIASLYNQTKKKPNQKTTNIYSNRTVSATAQFISPTPPPPPPSIFHNMFRKATKSKRIHSEASPIPPTPPPLPQAAVMPPPPSSIFNNIFKSGAKSKRFNSSTTPPPPTPLPPSSILNHLSKSESKSKRYYSSLAFQSPPPPPPKSETILRRTPKPPLPARVHKDYLYHSEENVNIFGIQSPPSQFEYAEQPEVERIDDWTTNVSESVREGTHSGGSVFCPSPDVNTKAEKFIARLRDEWRSDKMNSYREKL